jgi:5-methyltetrahydrofolate--homocysteine methyltransferase
MLGGVQPERLLVEDERGGGPARRATMTMSGEPRGPRHRRRPDVRRDSGGVGVDDRQDTDLAGGLGAIAAGARPTVEDSPANARWRALLAEGAPILADGAMGTMLFASGLQFGDPPEAWNVSHPEVVRRIHRGYLDAGSRIVMTNTFGGNRLRLRLHGLDARVSELNRTAAILLRAEADAAGGRALVAGDIGPTGEIMAPLGTLDELEATDVFREQAAALIAGGVDLIWIETMSHLSEITAAIRGARLASATIPVIATMTFDTRGYTMMGVSPEQAANALLAAGADAIGGNCGNGPDELLPVIEKMHKVAPEAVLVAKSNAGMPELIDLRAVYRADPATMADAGTGFQAAGARIIGACCGSTPAHLAAMAEVLGVRPSA